MDKVYLSTVTPVYQGEDYLASLVAEIKKVRDHLEEKDAPMQLVESIFVDDGSTDNSASILSMLESKNSWVKVIQLSRNFGQHSATIAGILHTSGDWVATLDEDLQHHPKYLVSLLLQCVEKKCDLIYAKPETSVHQSLFRDLFSRIYKALLSKLAGNPNVRHFNSFRVIRGSVARAAASVSGHDTYYDIALGWFTDRSCYKKLALKDHRYINKGKSGYRFSSLMEHARRMLTSSQIKSTRVGGIIGLLALLMSILLMAYTIIMRVIDPSTIQVRGWASTMLVLTFFGGLIALMVGIILEHISIILLHAQGKPAFFIVDRSSDSCLVEMCNSYWTNYACIDEPSSS